MIQLQRHIFGIVLPGLIIGVFALLLIFSLVQLSTIQRDMRIEATQNMLWVISRAHVSTLRLSESVAQHALGDVGAEEVQRKHDIFLSSVNLLDSGPQRRHMDNLGFGAELDGLSEALPGLENSIAALLQGDNSHTGAIALRLRPFEDMLGRAANNAMIAEWDDLGGRLDTTRNELRLIIISLGAISAAGGMMIFYLVFTSRASWMRARLLEQERAFSQLLVRSSNRGIVAVDLQGRCTLWNEAMQDLFGITAGNAGGRTLEDLSGFFALDRMRSALASAIDGNSSVLLDQALFRTGREQPHYLDVHAYPLRDGSGIIGAILQISDVTERHDAQRELARHRDHLEEEVAKRTRQLDAALARERAALNIYRNFAAMISHQFRTPLAIVDSALQRLMRRGDQMTTAELTERGGNARAAIARLVALVESTLDAARLDAGQIEIRKEPYDLIPIMEGLKERIRESWPAQHLLMSGADTRIMVLGDPVQTEHILLNLLSNAAKYAPQEADIRVDVFTDGPNVICKVSNEARIASEDADQLFTRYFRGQNAQGVSGVGIGLHMARSLARMQDGDLVFEGDKPGMAVFRLTLPAPNRAEIKERA